MTTDEDIVNALQGTFTREAAQEERTVNALADISTQESARNDELHRALNGLPSLTQEAADRAIVRSMRSTAETITGSAVGQGVPRPDDYISQLGMEAAKTSLRNRLMAADPTLTAGTADFRVEVAADAAYAAAERHEYEADRLDSVTEALKVQATPQKSTANEDKGSTPATFVRSNGKSTRI